MFTVRIDSCQSAQASRSVYECQRYTVDVAEGGASAALRLYAENGSEPLPVELRDGSIAYVMNARGVTVDVVRTQFNGENRS